MEINVERSWNAVGSIAQRCHSESSSTHRGAMNEPIVLSENAKTKRNLPLMSRLTNRQKDIDRAEPIALSVGLPQRSTPAVRATIIHDSQHKVERPDDDMEDMDSDFVEAMLLDKTPPSGRSMRWSRSSLGDRMALQNCKRGYQTLDNIEIGELDAHLAEPMRSVDNMSVSPVAQRLLGLEADSVHRPVHEVIDNLSGRPSAGDGGTSVLTSILDRLSKLEHLNDTQSLYARSAMGMEQTLMVREARIERDEYRDRLKRLQDDHEQLTKELRCAERARIELETKYIRETEALRAENQILNMNVSSLMGERRILSSGGRSTASRERDSPPMPPTHVDHPLPPHPKKTDAMHQIRNSNNGKSTNGYYVSNIATTAEGKAAVFAPYPPPQRLQKLLHSAASHVSNGGNLIPPSLEVCSKAILPHNLQPSHDRIQPSHDRIQPSHDRIQPSHDRIQHPLSLKPVNPWRGTAEVVSVPPNRSRTSKSAFTVHDINAGRRRRRTGTEAPGGGRGARASATRVSN